MKTFRLYQVDAFTKDKFRGNPAGVVPDTDGLTADQMQVIAREMNNSETAFILSPTARDHDVWVRFFTPTTEVPSCGHATIAAHYVRALENDLPSCTIVQKIGAGILPVDVIRQNNDYRIVMTQGDISFSEPLSDNTCLEILAAFGLDAGDLDDRCPIQIVSTGHSKVLIGIREQKTLHELRPNLSCLAALSRQISCNGYYVFTLASPTHDVLAHGRMFAPAIGIPEDPVTGNANGPLGAYLVHHQLVEIQGDTFSFKAKQGEAMGRPGIVEVSVDIEDAEPRTVRVGGHAVVVFKTEITV